MRYTLLLFAFFISLQLIASEEEEKKKYEISLSELILVSQEYRSLLFTDSKSQKVEYPGLARLLRVDKFLDNGWVVGMGLTLVIRDEEVYLQKERQLVDRFHFSDVIGFGVEKSFYRYATSKHSYLEINPGVGLSTPLSSEFLKKYLFTLTTTVRAVVKEDSGIFMMVSYAGYYVDGVISLALGGFYRI